MAPRAPKEVPSRPKMRPRWVPKGAKKGKKKASYIKTLPRGPKGLGIPPNGARYSTQGGPVFHPMGSVFHPRCPQEAPSRPKMRPRCLQEPSRCPKIHSTTPQMPPRCFQEALRLPKMPPRCPKMPPNACMCPNLLPKYFYMLQLNAKMRAKTPTQPYHARTMHPQKPVHINLSAAERAKRAESVLNSKL